MTAPADPPGHWVQCPECQRFFENEQGRGSHRLHAHGIRANGVPWRLPAAPVPASRPEPPAPTPTPPTPPVAPPATLPPPALTPPDPDPPIVTLKAEPDWSQPRNAANGMSLIAQSLAHTPPPPNMGRLGKAVVVFLVFALSGLALYFVVRDLKGANAPPPQPYVIDAARIQPGAPNRGTGDPYWDSILGYRGMRL